MKTLHIIILIITAFAFALISCTDNGPVSADERDAIVTQGITQMSSSTYNVPLKDSHLKTVNSEFQVGICPTPPEGQEDWYGWHFVMPKNNNFTALEVKFKGAGTFTTTKEDPFPGVFIAHPDNSHAYIWTATDDVLLGGSANSDGDNNFFVLSHTCPADVEGDPISVTKTVETTYKRTHDWSIDKKVETENGYLLDDIAKIWLYTDDSGDEKATWTVDVTYDGYEDSHWKVSGEITITNISPEDVTITNIIDKLDGNPIDLKCVEDYLVNGDYVLEPGNELICTYYKYVDSKIEGDNVVSVWVYGEDDPYSATEPIVWGDPETEKYATVEITDTNSGFALKHGNVTLDAYDYKKDEVSSFTYYEDFTWAYYGTENCEDGKTYDNTATIVETKQYAKATLKVNVQCFVYESAWALDIKDDVIDVFSFCDNGFNNWGWSNYMGPGSYKLDLYAGAGQCDTSKGTLVGNVTITYGGEDNFEYDYNLFDGHEKKEYHIYAGTDMFPQHQRGRRTVDTTAPGQYYIDVPSSGDDIYVIAHAVVGLPDPDFGPK